MKKRPDVYSGRYANLDVIWNFRYGFVIYDFATQSMGKKNWSVKYGRCLFIEEDLIFSDEKVGIIILVCVVSHQHIRALGSYCLHDDIRKSAGI